MAIRKCKVMSQVESVPSAPGDDPGRTPTSVGSKSPGGGSVGQRWRLRRNLVIYIANQHGASQRMLADVFDLPHSRISAILKEFRQQYGSSPQRLPD